MAAAIPVFTIYNAMILCQIPDTGNFQGQTDAQRMAEELFDNDQRMAEELFDNDFGTAMTKSIKQVCKDELCQDQGLKTESEHLYSGFAMKFGWAGTLHNTLS
ncbi:unnamed protein product [Cylindrotheca closterium]|uniref:Uncharacterized protein n=1 Tax=Cylindrotheca closterium TaxID=2856 RepID=A0AAD2CPS5_9STRA|nr:unnamed protein product [Cylindrotheca closterium]